MKTPLVRTVFAFCLCAVFCHAIGAQGLAASHQEQARFLLSQIERQLGKIKDFRCQKVTPLPALPGTLDPTVPRYRHEWLAADRQGRGRIKTSENGRISTQIWDGAKTIEHRADVDPCGVATHQVFVAEGIHFPTRRHNEPWVYLGSDVANLLTAALQGQHTVRISQNSAGHYRADIRTADGAAHTVMLDPQQGYAPVYHRLYAKGKMQTLETVTFKKVESNRANEDIWFPFEVQTEIGPQQTRLSAPILKCRFVEVSINNYDFEQSLKLGFAPGTRVYDRVRGQTYVVGEDTIELLENPTPAATDANAPAPVPPEASEPQTEAPGWQAAFDAAYQLEDSQDLKCIAPPFIPERAQYLASMEPGLASQTGRVLENRLYQFQWDSGLEGNRQVGTNRYLELSAVLENVVGLGSYEYEGLPHLLNLPLTGDWIVRKDASTEQLLGTLEQIVKDQRQWSIGFVKQQADAIVIRASGSYRLRALPQFRSEEGVHIYTGNVTSLRGDAPHSNACDTVARFLQDVAHGVGMRIIDDTQSSELELCWVSHNSAQLRDRRNSPSLYNTQLASLLNNLTAQTGLSFKIELGTVDRWQVAPQRGATARSN